MQVAMTVAMVGITYSSVPLYRMFCQVPCAPRLVDVYWSTSCCSTPMLAQN